MRPPRVRLRTLMAAVAVVAVALGVALEHPILGFFLVVPIGPALIWTIASADQWRHRERGMALAQAVEFFAGAALRVTWFAGVAGILIAVVLGLIASLWLGS